LQVLRRQQSRDRLQGFQNPQNVYHRKGQDHPQENIGKLRQASENGFFRNKTVEKHRPFAVHDINGEISGIGAVSIGPRLGSAVGLVERS